MMLIQGYRLWVLADDIHRQRQHVILANFPQQRLPRHLLLDHVDGKFSALSIFITRDVITHNTHHGIRVYTIFNK